MKKIIFVIMIAAAMLYAFCACSYDPLSGVLKQMKLYEGTYDTANNPEIILPPYVDGYCPVIYYDSIAELKEHIAIKIFFIDEIKDKLTKVSEVKTIFRALYKNNECKDQVGYQIHYYADRDSVESGEAYYINVICFREDIVGDNWLNVTGYAPEFCYIPIEQDWNNTEVTYYSTLHVKNDEWCNRDDRHLITFASGEYNYQLSTKIKN